MEAIKSRKTNIIVLLLSVGFLFLASCAFGQVERMASFDSLKNKEVVTRYFSRPLELKSPLFSKDFISINAKSDSIDDKTITFDVYAYFPKNINPNGNNIVIGYTDGTTDTMQQTMYLLDDNYAEYHPINGINNLASKKISYILIRGIIKCETKDKTYFKDFLSYL